MSIIFINNKPVLLANTTASGVKTLENLSAFIGQNNFIVIPTSGQASATSITVGLTHTVAENSSFPIVELTATGHTGTTPTFNIVADYADSNLFDIDEDNQLFVISPGLDFEAWTDDDGDGVYVVRVRAFDGYSEDFKDIEITPTNAYELLAGSWAQYGTSPPITGYLHLSGHGDFGGSYNGYISLVIHDTDQNNDTHSFDGSYVGRLIRLVHESSGTNQICAIVAASFSSPLLTLTLASAIGITAISFPTVDVDDLIFVEMLDNSALKVTYNATSGNFNAYPGASNRDYNVDNATFAGDFAAHAVVADGHAYYTSGNAWLRLLFWLDQIIEPESISSDISLVFSTSVTPTLALVTDGINALTRKFTVGYQAVSGTAFYTTYDSSGNPESNSSVNFDDYGFITACPMNGTYTLINGGVGYGSVTYEANSAGTRTLPVYASGVSIDIYSVQTGVDAVVETYTLVTLPSGFTLLTGGTFKFQADGVDSSELSYSNDAGPLQTAIRTLAGWETATVDGSGTVAAPYAISAGNPGIKNNLSIVNNTLTGATNPEFTAAYQRVLH